MSTTAFATDSFPTLQSEARKFAIDTIVAHQYRDQLNDLNRGSTLNVGNFIVFRVTGVDAREIAMQFDNTPPEADPILKSVPRRTGREGLFRTTGEQVFVEGCRRQYNDVERESANQLTNNPNYHAYCKFIDSGLLVEHYIKTRRVDGAADPSKAEEIRRRSRLLGTPRAEVEERIASLWREDDDTQRGYRMD